MKASKGDAAGWIIGLVLVIAMVVFVLWPRKRPGNAPPATVGTEQVQMPAGLGSADPNGVRAEGGAVVNGDMAPAQQAETVPDPVPLAVAGGVRNLLKYPAPI